MLTLRGVSKSFPGVQALDAIDLDVAAGEIHALVGENGAGKSTLIKTIAGVYRPDRGTMTFQGEPAAWSSPGEAKRHGIHVVYQEFVLFPQLSVAENIFLGHERRNRLGLVDHARTRSAARELMARLGIAIDPRRPAGELSVADRQMIEIARALVQDVRLLILDEPTAVISGREATLLFERLRVLRQAGVAILFISHRLDEIFSVCDRVTVLKDGRLVGTEPVAAVSRERLITMMIGRDLTGLYPPKRRARSAASPVLRTEALAVSDRVRGISIEIRAGEITALAGMVGAGRSDLAFGIFGALPITAGAISVGGQRFTSMTPARAIALGIGLVSEDRKGQGLAMLLDVAANISAPALAEFARHGLLDREREEQAAQAEIEKYRIVCRGPRAPVATMSGGNQQKVILARWARICRTLLILDEPTRGVDVGAKAEIYRIMRELAESGLAILMISSEMTEVIGMADKVIVMREGSVTGELAGAAITEAAIMNLAAFERAA